MKKIQQTLQTSQAPSLPLSTIEYLVGRYNLKPQQVSGKMEWHGPNPFETGALDDGFWLNENGSAYDRKTERHYTALEVAQLAGVALPQRHSPQKKAKPTRTIIFDYHAPDGSLLYRVHRKEFADGSKEFPIQRVDSSGSMKWGLGDVSPVLYRAPELKDAQTVFVVEGEKCADALNAALKAEGLSDYVATTAPCGDKWITPFSEQLRGKRLFVLPDNDSPGERHADKVCNALYGIASSLAIIRLPGLPEKGDVVDFLAGGGTIEQLFDLMGAAPAWTTTQVSPSAPESSNQSRPLTFSAAELMAMQLPPVRWVVPGIIGEGLTVCAGNPKLGKSYFWLNIGLAVATGGVALGSLPIEKAGDVLYMALEDTRLRLQVRLKQMLGQEKAPSRLEFACEWPQFDRGGKEALEAWLIAHPNASLIVIDTFKVNRPQRGLGRDIYGEDYEHARLYKSIADKYGVALVLIHHTTKLTSDDPLKTVSGTQGLTGAADTILVLTRERTSSKAIGFVTGRDVSERRLELMFDLDLGAWRYIGDKEEAPIEPKETERAAFNVLKNHFPNGATATQWEKACAETEPPLSRATFYRARDALCNEWHLVSRIEIEGSRTQIYRAVEEQETSPIELIDG